MEVYVKLKVGNLKNVIYWKLHHTIHVIKDLYNSLLFNIVAPTTLAFSYLVVTPSSESPLLRKTKESLICGWFFYQPGILMCKFSPLERI